MPDPMLDRRDFLTGAAATAAAARAMPGRAAMPPGLGRWTVGPLGLPAYAYTGPLTFTEPVADGQRRLPDDPHFLLGNQRLTLFAHASGRLRLISAERAWADMNGGGVNAATLTVDGSKRRLTGIDRPAAAAADKQFTVGGARFAYAPEDDVAVVRALSVKPSPAVGVGYSGVVVCVEIVNTGPVPRRIGYRESFGGGYRPIEWPWTHERDRVLYVRSVGGDARAGIAWIATQATAADALSLPPHPAMARFDASPPALFVAAPPGSGLTAAATGDALEVAAAFTLAPGERRRLRFVLGYGDDPAAVAGQVATLLHGVGVGPDLYAAEWRRVVPAFADEADPVLRREMQWNVATLEAMANVVDYYGESIVSEGSTYDFDWGLRASSRDFAQHALPLCRTNPRLARSVIRFLFKRMVGDGEIKLNDEGYGWAPTGAQTTSDQQLYLFMLVTEYLEATGDAAILDAAVDWYPRETGATASGLAHLVAAFRYLRDRIGTGAHGLIRLWNSDWNDMFYFWKTDVPYAAMFNDAESHMNSAMAAVLLPQLAAQLRRFAAGRPAAAALAAAADAFAGQVEAALLRDMDGRSFARRAYLGRAGARGEDSLWLEPQPFLLQLPRFPVERKRALFTEVQRRVMAGEAMGARQVERSSAEGDLKSGMRENGGFWYALNGPLALGLATFDPATAQALLRRMTFDHYARAFPAYWPGRWSAADSLDASTLPTAGLSTFAIWCAHPHAWPLHVYLKLRAAGDRTT